MEQVGGLVPVDPHASEIVSKEVVERITRKETEAVRNPVGLIRSLIVIGFCPLSQLPDGLGTLLVSSRPDAQSDTIESVRGVLLQNIRMVDAMGLATSGADFNIVREACLFVMISNALLTWVAWNKKNLLTLIAACNERAISLSCSSLGLLPRISGSQN